MYQEFETIERVLLDLYERQDYKALHEEMLELDAIDIAEFLSTLQWEDFAVIYRLLPKSLGLEVFVHLDSEMQEGLINALEDPQVVELINTLYNDDLADILDEMPASVVKRVLKNTNAERRNQVNHLLQYPEYSAGSIMTTEYMHLEGNITIAEAFQRLRTARPKLETIYSCYVTTSDNRLEGVISVRDIFSADDEAKVEDVMEEAVVSVLTTDNRENVANLFARYDFLAVPVTDKEDRLVGIITIDDVLDVIQEEASEDMTKMAAVNPGTKEYLETSVWDHSKSRIVWLLFLMVSGLLNALILTKFEEALMIMPILVSYIPMLTDTGGNAGSQSSATIIRSMTLAEIGQSDFFSTIWKEMRVGFVVGSAMALVNLVRVYIMDGHNVLLALTVSLALLCVAIVAKVLGAALPMLAKRLNLDPAVMAGPLITTLLDAITLLIYFGLAYIFLLSSF